MQPGTCRVLTRVLAFVGLGYRTTRGAASLQKMFSSHPNCGLPNANLVKNIAQRVLGVGGRYAGNHSTCNVNANANSTETLEPTAVGERQNNISRICLISR